MATTPADYIEIQTTRFRRRWLRVASVVLILNGLAGLVALVIALGYVAKPLGDASGFDESVQRSRDELIDTLEQTARGLGSAATAFDGFDDSLAQAQASSTNAAGLSREVAGTMNAVAGAMNVNIFGTQPFANVVPLFQRAGQQLNDLGANLDTMTAALGRNADDIGRAQTELAALRGEVDELATSVREISIPETGEAIPALRIALYALLGWLALFSLSSLVVGVALWRALHPH